MRPGQHDQRGQERDRGERVGEEEVRAEGEMGRHCRDQPAHDSHPPADEARDAGGQQDAPDRGHHVLDELPGEESPAQDAVDDGEIQRISGGAGQEAGARGIRMARPEDPLAAQDPHRRLVIAPGHARSRLHAGVHDGGEVHGVEGPHGQGEEENGGQGDEAGAPRRHAGHAQRGGGPGPPSREKAHGRCEQFTPRTRFARVRPPPPGECAGRHRPPRYNSPTLAMALTAPSASFLTAHSAILVFLAMGIGFLVMNLIIWSIIRPSRFSEEKLTTYECGENPTGSALGAVQHPLLRVRPHLHHLRRGGRVPAALGGGVRPARHGPSRLRRGAGVHRHPRRGPGLRLAQGRPRVGARRGPDAR